jgi:hypothetical protein
MPTIGPSRPCATSNGSSFGGIPADFASRLLSADNVLRTLVNYVPGTFPERPADLELGDTQLREAAAKKHRGGRLTKVEIEALRLLGSWRAAVRRIEQVSVGNLLMLLGVVNMLEAADRQGDADTVREFMVCHYGAVLPGPPAPRSHTDWAERWADRHSQNRQVLPLALRTMSEDDLTVQIQPTKEESETDPDESF